MKRTQLLLLFLLVGGMIRAQLLESNQKSGGGGGSLQIIPYVDIYRLPQSDVWEAYPVARFDNYEFIRMEKASPEQIKAMIEAQNEIISLRKDMLTRALQQNRSLLQEKDSVLNTAWNRYMEQANKIHELKDLEIQHFNDSICRLLLLDIQIIRHHVKELTGRVKTLEDQVHEFEGKQKLLREIAGDEPERFSDLIEELRSANEASVKLVADISALLRDMVQLQIKSEDYAEELEKLVKLKKAGTEKKEEKENDPFQALPALTALQKNVLPQITLIGNRKFEGDNIYGEIRLFTGAENQSERGANLKGLNMLVPEFSSFGFSASATYSTLSYLSGKVMGDKVQNLDRLGFSFRLGYYGKTLNIDSTSFSAGVIQATLGAEVILVSQGVSLYGNMHMVKVTDQIGEFSEYYTRTNEGSLYDEKSTRNYFEVGIKSLLDIGGDAVEGLNLKFDFGMLILNNTLRDMVKTPDIAIPLIRIGLQKTISI